MRYQQANCKSAKYDRKPNNNNKFNNINWKSIKFELDCILNIILKNNYIKNAYYKAIHYIRNEIQVIIIAYTLANKKAMMVHSKYTFVTNRAMVVVLLFIYLTLLAISLLVMFGVLLVLFGLPCLAGCCYCVVERSESEYVYYNYCCC